MDPHPNPPNPPFTPVVMAAIYLFLYVALDWLTDVRPALTLGITPWNPQAGLTVAFLAFAGPAWLPLTALAAIISDSLIHAPPATPLLIFIGAGWMALVYGALAAFQRYRALVGPLQGSVPAAQLAGSATLAALLVSCGYVGIFMAAGVLPAQEVMRSILRYWLGDLNGILMLAPLLFHQSEWRAAPRMLRDHGKELALQAAAVLTALLIIFALPAGDQLRFFSLLFIPIIWIALRWSIPGAILAVALAQTGLIVAAWTQIHTPRFIDLQFLMLVLSLTALLLGAVVTSRRRAEKQLRDREETLARAMRVAVAGELAAALAHKLNQPITALVSYVQAAEILSRQAASADDRLPATLGKAAREALRASRVLRQLRQSYGSRGMKNEKVHIPRLCDAVARAHLDRLQSQNIELNLAVDPSIPEIDADSAHLEIVLHNILANAIDAVSATEDRRIALHGSCANDVVTLRVEDSGVGIPENIRAKLFEPLVTTKRQGMGLGLAVSRTLIRARGGELDFTPKGSLGGALFIISLPVAAPREIPSIL